MMKVMANGSCHFYLRHSLFDILRFTRNGIYETVEPYSFSPAELVIYEFELSGDGATDAGVVGVRPRQPTTAKTTQHTTHKPANQSPQRA